MNDKYNSNLMTYLSMAKLGSMLSELTEEQLTLLINNLGYDINITESPKKHLLINQLVKNIIGTTSFKADKNIYLIEEIQQKLSLIIKKNLNFNNLTNEQLKYFMILKIITNPNNSLEFAYDLITSSNLNFNSISDNDIKRIRNLIKKYNTETSKQNTYYTNILSYLKSEQEYNQTYKRIKYIIDLISKKSPRTKAER